MSQIENSTKPRRRFKRIPQHFPVDLFISDDGSAHSPDSPRVRGIATDLGPGGMQVLLGAAHQVGTYMSIEIKLEGKIYTLGGRVRHIRWVSATPGMMFGHGIEIVDVTEPTIRAIVSYLAKHIGRRAIQLPKAA